ncbi:hypothetical protein [Thermomonospora cellulosilytica]|uniref:Mce-associated membrane protein n=1 Tax=Thermomonospora cellulosilytica TaxID=1411118 RepID=A0A7W3MSZ4_9ACTN|nr:hypothetical protein [Thermomonospora cellulosilytica]MBA9001314.1 Mce-associated membrane protein [Thermomonospora cellulosilytica]
MTVLGRGKRAGKDDKADKARKAEEAARRAEELAEQARKAAEEARAALEEAEAEKRERAAEKAGKGAGKSGGSGRSAAVRPKYALTEETDQAGEDVGTGTAETETGDEDAVAASPATADDADDVDAAAVEADDDTTATETDNADETDDADEVEDDGPRDVEDDLVRDEAEETGTADEDDGDAPEAAAGRTRRKVVFRSGLGTSGVVLLTLAVLLGAAAGWLWVQDNRLANAEEARKQVMFAAAQAAQDLSSYDYRTVDSDLRRAAAHTTGKFKDEFARTTPQVKANAARQQVVTEGIALKTGVERVDGDEAVAIVFLNQETAKAATAQRLPSQFRLRLTMRKVDGRWLVEKLEVL